MVMITIKGNKPFHRNDDYSEENDFQNKGFS